MEDNLFQLFKRRVFSIAKQSGLTVDVGHDGHDFQAVFSDGTVMRFSTESKKVYVRFS